MAHRIVTSGTARLRLYQCRRELSFRPKGGICFLPQAKKYYVYIMSSKSRVLYVGVTGFAMARVLQHKACQVEGFTKRYRVTRLVYYEVFQYVNNAIARETEIKNWRREKKVALIEAANPPGKIWPRSGVSRPPCKQQIPPFGRNGKAY